MKFEWDESESSKARIRLLLIILWANIKEWKGALEKGHVGWDLLFKDITPIAAWRAERPREEWRRGFARWRVVGEGPEKKPSTQNTLTHMLGDHGLWGRSRGNAYFAILSKTWMAWSHIQTLFWFHKFGFFVSHTANGNEWKQL